jgi:Peptidase M50B-like
VPSVLALSYFFWRFGSNSDFPLLEFFCLVFPPPPPGLAAILSGGYVAKLEIFQNGSGLAYTASQHAGLVSSAGYPGTAVTGGLLLLFRRTTLGPTVGTIGLGAALLLSVMCFVRNGWGMWALSLEGLALLAAGWCLPAHVLDHLYNFLSLTVALNAIENINDLYGSSQGYAGGELRNTDAQSTADAWGGDYRVWATVWLAQSFLCTGIGILFALDARALPWSTGTATATATAPCPYYLSAGNGTVAPPPPAAATTTAPAFFQAPATTTAAAAAKSKNGALPVATTAVPFLNLPARQCEPPPYAAHVV